MKKNPHLASAGRNGPTSFVSVLWVSEGRLESVWMVSGGYPCDVQMVDRCT